MDNPAAFVCLRDLPDRCVALNHNPHITRCSSERMGGTERINMPVRRCMRCPENTSAYQRVKPDHCVCIDNLIRHIHGFIKLCQTFIGFQFSLRGCQTQAACLMKPDILPCQVLRIEIGINGSDIKTVMAGSCPKWVVLPAACHVEPEVSSPFQEANCQSSHVLPAQIARHSQRCRRQ